MCSVIHIPFSQGLAPVDFNFGKNAAGAGSGSLVAAGLVFSGNIWEQHNISILLVGFSL